MTRWIWLVLCSGCLVVMGPEDDDSIASGQNALPIGEVHPCTIIVEDASAYWTICFAADEHVKAFEDQMMANCEYNGIDCDVKCSMRNLRPCAITCPGVPFFAQACNSSYGCYCPPE
jgi:hypothetical protein